MSTKLLLFVLFIQVMLKLVRLSTEPFLLTDTVLSKSLVHNRYSTSDARAIGKLVCPWSQLLEEHLPGKVLVVLHQVANELYHRDNEGAKGQRTQVIAEHVPCLLAFWVTRHPRGHNAHTPTRHLHLSHYTTKAPCGLRNDLKLF